jgi:hypothetical protein
MTYKVIVISNKYMQMCFSDPGPSTKHSILDRWLHYSADYSSSFVFLLSVLAKQLLKVTIRLLVSLHFSVCMQQREYHLTGFRDISYFGIFMKICQHIPILI